MILTKNDRRTLESVRDAIKLGGYERWVPHLQRERVGARRLVAFGLVTNLGPCPCRDCDNPRHYGNDAPSSYVLTTKGKRALAKVPR